MKKGNFVLMIAMASVFHAGCAPAESEYSEFFQNWESEGCVETSGASIADDPPPCFKFSMDLSDGETGAELGLTLCSDETCSTQYSEIKIGMAVTFGQQIDATYEDQATKTNSLDLKFVSSKGTAKSAEGAASWERHPLQPLWFVGRAYFRRG